MDSYSLEIKKVSNEFVLVNNNKPIFIAQGEIEVKSKSKSFLEYLLKDFERCAEISVKDDNTIDFNGKFCAYAIYSDQKYLIEGVNNKNYQDDLSNLLFKYDLSLITTSNGPPFETQQLGLLTAVRNKIIEIVGKENFLKMCSYAWGAYYDKTSEDLDHGVGETISDEEYKKSRIKEKLTNIFQSFSNEEKGAVSALRASLGNMSVIAPILLVSDNISLSAYTNAYMGIGDNFTYVYEGAEDEKEEKARYQQIYDAGFNTASIILKYLENSSRMLSEDNELLNKDESITHELKSTLRMNLASKQKDDRMVRDVLKTIVGFLNTKGGILLIGVSDDKTIIGLEEDKFKNLDEWQRYLKDQINNKIGNGFLENFIHPSFIKKDDKDVAVIKCDQLPKEKTAFLEDTVYVRQTASTKKLSSKEALEWKENRLSKI